MFEVLQIQKSHEKSYYCNYHETLKILNQYTMTVKTVS